MLNEGLNGGLKILLELIKKYPNINANGCSQKLKRPLDTVDKQIKKLIDKKLIERKGSRKTGGYYPI